MTAYYNENEQFELDTINKEFYMRVQFDQEWIVAANYSLMDQAYATSCVYEEQNRIAFGTLKLTSANSFIHKDKLIPARFNLFEMEALDTLRGHWSPDYLEITFHQEFVDSSDFSTPSLMLQLSGSTNDNQPILIKKEIWIKLNPHNEHHIQAPDIYTRHHLRCHTHFMRKRQADWRS